MKRFEVKHIYGKYEGDRGELLYRHTTCDEEGREYSVEIRKIDEETCLVEVTSMDESQPEGCEVLVKAVGADNVFIEAYEPREHWQVVFELEENDEEKEIKIGLGLLHLLDLQIKPL